MLVTAIIAAAIAAAPAQPVRGSNAEADYIRTVAANGTITLRGQDKLTGKMFRYTVYKDGKVSGWVGSDHVRFQLR